MKAKKIFLTLTVQIIVVISILILIEIISFFILKNSEINTQKYFVDLPSYIASKPAPFYGVNDFDQVKEQYTKKASRCRGKIIYNKSDGFPEYSKRNFNCYGETLENGLRQTNYQPNNYNRRVLVFGGSTLWGSGSANRNSIPSLIQKKLNEIRPNEYIVFNYGFTTVNITQQLNKLKSLEIEENDIVIFYDGGNDAYQGIVNENPNGSIIGFNQNNKKDIYVQNIKYFLGVHSNAYKILSNIKAKKGNKNLKRAKRLAECPENTEGRTKQLIKNSFDVYQNKILEANNYVLRSKGTFFHFLQPSLWYRNNELSEYEKVLLTQTPLGINSCKLYLQRMQEGYQFFHNSYNKMQTEYTNNLIDAFNPIKTKEEYYIDSLHVSSKGNEVIKNEIVKTILEK